MPRTRHSHAAALGDQNPRVCVHTRAARLSLATATPLLRHDPATALPCAVITRRGRDVVFTSRPSPLGISLSTHQTHATHTHALTYRHGHSSPSRTGSGSHTDRWAPPVRGSKERCPLGPFCQCEREGERSGSWADLLSRAGLHAQLAQGLSRPAEPQVELTHGAKLSLVGLEPAQPPLSQNQTEPLSIFFYPA
jgi:hypothetical protein